MQKKSAGSENLIGVGGSIKDGASKIWGQLVVGLLSNFKNRILGGWLSLLLPDVVNCHKGKSSFLFVDSLGVVTFLQ